MVPSLLLLSCESTVSVKENPDRKKQKNSEIDSKFGLCAPPPVDFSVHVRQCSQHKKNFFSIVSG